ncbi:MAG: glycosyltransferase family 4 protein [Solirubrobacterales bacterium]|nr:glycosyltransferase family 4 protein [Solirubrobacterales bacterium]
MASTTQLPLWPTSNGRRPDSGRVPASVMPGAAPWCTVLVVEHAEGLYGAQRYLLALAPLLEQRGIRQVLAAPAGSETAAQWRRAGLDARELRAPFTRSVRTASGRLHPVAAASEVGRVIALARRTAALASACQADVLHANSHWSHLEGALAGRLARIPAVLHLHEQSEPDLLGRMRGLAVRGASASIAVSNAVAASLPTLSRRGVTVIHNGIDPEVFFPSAPDPRVRAELAADPSAPVLLTLSRLDPLKRIDKVIRAVAGLPSHLARCQLAIAGTPSLVPEHGERLRSLGRELLGERVRFLGARDDVRELLCASDALVLASSLEGLPLSVLEAQACARPVVAFPSGGVPEVVEHEATGLLARPGDVADLGVQLTRLLTDGYLRRRISSAGRDQVLARHTLARQADLQAALLRELLGAGARSPASGGHP